MGAELALGQATLGPEPWELLKSGPWPAPEDLWPEPRRWDAVYKSRPLSPRSLAVLHDLVGHKACHCQPASDASDLDESHQEPERLSEPEPQPGPSEVEPKLPRQKREVVADATAKAGTELWRAVADRQLEEAETAVREASLRRLETEVRLLNTELQDMQQEGTQLRLRAQTAEAMVSALMQENQALVEQLRPKH